MSDEVGEVGTRRGVDDHVNCSISCMPVTMGGRLLPRIGIDGGGALTVCCDGVIDREG